MRMIALLGAACFLAISGCSASSTSSRPGPETPVVDGGHIGLVHIRPRLRGIGIGATPTCPRTLGDARGVHNPGLVAEHSLVPTTQPVAALICAYTRFPSSHLRHTPIRLEQPAAAALAAQLRRVRLGVVTDPVSCPADVQTVELVVLSYRGRALALWYDDSGCQSINNGYVQAGQIASSSFASFQALLARIAPALGR